MYKMLGNIVICMLHGLRLLESPSKDSLKMEGKISWFNAVVPTLWTGYCWIVSIHSCLSHFSAKPLTLLKIILLLNSFPLIAIFGIWSLGDILICFSWIQRAYLFWNWFSLTPWYSYLLFVCFLGKVINIAVVGNSGQNELWPRNSWFSSPQVTFVSS